MYIFLFFQVVLFFGRVYGANHTSVGHRLFYSLHFSNLPLRIVPNLPIDCLFFDLQSSFTANIWLTYNSVLPHQGDFSN